MKVSSVWRMGFIFMCGMLIGCLVTVKILQKDATGNQFIIEKLKIKGNNNELPINNNQESNKKKKLFNR
jgi:hypothetical protein